jgi:hypothetical protein
MVEVVVEPCNGGRWYEKDERHGESGDRLRTEVDKPDGWSYVLEGYRKLISAADPAK